MKKILLLLLLGGSSYAFCQTELGLEFQVYPTGFISGIHIEYEIGAHSGLQGRVGYNLIRHRDLGIQEDERGGGFGGTLGYRYYSKEKRKGLMLGARCDLWWNEIDWKNNIGLPEEASGTTKVTVLQPTAELGYILLLKNNFLILPTIALGAEINIKTKGAETGQGAILLLGTSIIKRF